MAGLIMIALWVFFYFISYKRNKVHTNDTPSVWAEIIIYWLVVGIPVLFSFKIHFLVGYTLLMLVVSPYFLARLPIYLGWVKVSAFLTRYACIFFSRNTFAGSLFSGYLAAKRIKNIEEKQAALSWLREKFLNNRAKLFSGEVVAYILIDSELTHPDDNKYLAQRLTLLKSLPGGSIPKKMALYCCKRALANALPSNNWETVMPVVEQWNRINKASLTLVIDSFYRINVSPEELNFVKKNWYRFIYYLNFVRHLKVRRWCLANKQIKDVNNVDHISSRADAINQVWCQQQNGKQASSELQHNIVSALMVDPVHWDNRAQELGCWNGGFVDSVYDDIRSLFKGNELSQEQYDFINEKHDALHYMANSINSKREPYSYKNVTEETVDFLQFLSVFNQLKEYESEQLTAFSKHHNTLWNWMADLWNNQNEYRLSYMIGEMCYPFAKKCNYDDFVESISFVISKENE